ncbi:calcium-binding protein [Sedimentitalea arenosa]|nr:calcium-binding protein [Arenibacterium arenosum]
MALRDLGTRVTIESAGYDGGAVDPDIAVLANGNLVVVWCEYLDRPTDAFDDMDGAIFGQILSPDGIPIGEIFQVNESQTFLQHKPQVTAQPDGSFIVGWVNVSRFGSHTTDTDTFLRHFNASGSPIASTLTDIRPDTPYSSVEQGSEQQILQEIVSLSEKRFAVLLENGTAHVYNASGTLVALPGVADDMVQLANGNILRAVVVSDSAHDKPGHAIKLTLTDDKFGAPKGIAGIHNELSFLVDGNWSAKKDANNLELVALNNGGAALGFMEERADGSSRLRVEFLSDHAALDHSARPVVRNFSYDAQAGEFDMLALSNGGVAVAMATLDPASGHRGIDLLFLGEDGVRQGPVQSIGAGAGGSRSFPTLAERADGTLVLTYTDGTVADENPLQVAFFERTDIANKLVGSSVADDLTGTAGHDTIFGHDGNDIISGRKGDDLLRGGAGNDAIEGGAGRDSLRGGDGDDVLNGGSDADGLAGHAGNDRINGGVGNDVLGGGQGDDILNGQSGRDVLKGGEGSDVLTGGVGRDTFIFVNGHAGQDRITDFDHSADTIRISLRAGNAADLQVTSAAGSTFIGIGTVDVELSGVVLGEADIVFQFV